MPEVTLDDERIIEDAAFWSQRLKGAGDFDQTAFDQWLAADERHAEALMQVDTANAYVEENLNAPELLLMRSEALQRAHRAGASRWRTGGEALTRRVILSGAAASVAAAVGAGFLFWRPTTSYATGVGEQRTVTLADNSRVFLDANSHLRIAMSDEARRIDLLSGRAHFEVAKDPTRPFSVHADDKIVTAVGTAFTVEYRQQKVAVTLIEGRILVKEQSAGRSAKVLTADIKPSQQLVMVAGADTPELVDKVDIQRTMGWRDGTLNFDDERLDEVAGRMNDYSKTRIVVDGAAAKGLRISGTFRAGETGAFVEAIESYYPVHAETDGDTVIIRART
ncbi:FecR family protein [Asticcacaulis sp.]|uniref:FecR family protein n=1 Tax=Asticcacaulis sp. TaxID=1872648 RepID=UPI002C3D6E27|nr:FecR domain-containing protein [Asticcacaulis sp.]HTM81629.1 FecR domain-containing protein [Asticcacaulis sp.]